LGVGLTTPSHKKMFCWEASKIWNWTTILEEAKVHQGL
jgi:hypothetical protein